MQIKSLVIATVTAVSTMHSFAADTVIVESRKANGALNAPVWSEVSGKWGRSKNKTRIASWSSLTGTNVSICVTNRPVPAFKVSPELEPGTTYKVETTFSTTTTHVAAPDLVVMVAAEGLSENSIPTNTPAFQGSGADSWNMMGTITPATNRPALTFTYSSGTLSRESRWYADAIRFTPQPTLTDAD